MIKKGKQIRSPFSFYISRYWYGFIQKCSLSLCDTGIFWETSTLAYLEKQAHRKTKNIMQQNKKKYDPAMMPRFFYYSDFFNGLLILGLDFSFYKCAILTCRRSVKRISWNKIVQRWHFCDKTLPFSKTILSFLSLVWWESQFTVESRSHVFFGVWIEF